MYVVLGGFLSNLQQEMLQVYYIFYLFDVIIKISAINCCIGFITVVNYVKAITSDIMSQLRNEMNLICISKDFISQVSSY